MYIILGLFYIIVMIQRIVEILRSLLLVTMLVTTWLTSWTLTTTLMTVITTTTTLTTPPVAVTPYVPPVTPPTPQPATYTVTLPALRERREDIPLLADHIITELATQHQLKPKKILAQTAEKLKEYEIKALILLCLAKEYNL